ncbi:SDR family oxidoreductase [Nakamurella deserti]|uniref:SDR family oxidoreductase n=1 Tax=Nakamurella deserti TaxID=2164074 RepID=UPI00130051B9|nr:NmrA family NAD(P)-binding protein [Nakamurella deserti]
MTSPSSARRQSEVVSTTTATTAATDLTRLPVVLVTGATGRIGGELVGLVRQDTSIELRAAVRRPEQAAHFAAQGVRSVHLDLDDYDGFAAALDGIDWLFLIAGYTVDMLAQGKNLVDSAEAAGIRHILHLGTFHQPGRPMERYVGHMIWHQLLESYIQAPGLGYTHLRPNVFMQAILGELDSEKYCGTWGTDPSAGWTAPTSPASPQRSCASPHPMLVPLTT